MNEILIPLLALMIPIIIVPTALGIKHARFLREMEHAERIKAMEAGRTLPQDETWSIPAKVCVTIGGLVPIGVFFCAWMATNSVGFHAEIWAAAAIMGVSAVGCGSVLSYKLLSLEGRGERDLKPMMDADALDVVGSRG
ncbi:MAG: hypothetical protein NVSMB9_04170 [Isosphaeraceae bacterium]